MADDLRAMYTNFAAQVERSNAARDAVPRFAQLVFSDCFERAAVAVEVMRD